MVAGAAGYCDYTGYPISLLGTLAFTPGTTISVARTMEAYHTYIDLPSYSPWLDELYFTFFDDTQTPRQGNPQVQLMPNFAWPDRGDGTGGCIDWETTYGWNGTSFDAGAMHHQTMRLHIADCNDFSIPLAPISSWNSVRLVSTGEGFEDLIVLSRPLDFGTNTGWFNFTRDRVLDFHQNRFVTGINIIDDMLFWTDGHTEPKKINIQRSIEGTQSDGQKHTRVVNNVNDSIQIQDIPIREEHITVIKKSPTTPLTMQLDTGRNTGLTHTAIMRIATENAQGLSSFRGNHYDFSALGVGDYFRIDLEESIKGETEFTLSKPNGKPWEPGTKVALKEFDEDGEAPTLSVENYRIKATIGDWQWNKMDAEEGDGLASIQPNTSEKEPMEKLMQIGFAVPTIRIVLWKHCSI